MQSAPITTSNVVN